MAALSTSVPEEIAGAVDETSKVAVELINCFRFIINDTLKITILFLSAV